MTFSELYARDPRTLTRATYAELARDARKQGYSLKVGDCYIGRGGVAPCTLSGVLLRGVWDKIRHAQYCRRQGRLSAARQILALPDPHPCTRSKF